MRIAVVRRTLASIAPIALSCSSVQTFDPVAVGPQLLAPQSLLSNVSRIEIRVFESSPGTTCDDATGKVANVPEGAAIATAELASSGCDQGVRYCGRLELSRSDRPRLFVAKAFAGPLERASGCALSTVTQDYLPLRIKLVRAIPVAVCQNGVLEPTEQCEPTSPSDAVCTAWCQSKEVRLSNEGYPSSLGGLGNIATSPPSLLWNDGTGSSGKFIALYNDLAASNRDIGMRVLNSEFGPYRDQGKAIESGAVFLPHSSGNGPSFESEANDQLNAAGVSVGANHLAVFQSDNGSSTGSFDIHLRTLDALLVPQAAPSELVVVNGDNGGGEAGAQSLPSIAAGPNGLVFIAWQDDVSGKIKGRTWSIADRQFGTTMDIASGSGNRWVRLAGLPEGWVATWQSGSNIAVRRLGRDGSPISSELFVNNGTHRGRQETPVVASLADGRFAIAWADTGGTQGTDIFFQRFDKDGAPVSGDQDSPLHDLITEGDQTAPAIASSNNGNGLYAVAWLDETSGHVRARYPDANGGFLFNNVTGQSSEFSASLQGGRTRRAPAIAIGGSGPFVAIGWEDRTGDISAGVYGRRFPYPSE